MVTIVKWGNSLAIRLPKGTLEKARLLEGDTLEVEARSGAILLRPTAMRTLAQLVALITPENLHADVLDGKRSGSEAW